MKFTNKNMLEYTLRFDHLGQEATLIEPVRNPPSKLVISYNHNDEQEDHEIQSIEAANNEPMVLKRVQSYVSFGPCEEPCLGIQQQQSCSSRKRGSMYISEILRAFRKDVKSKYERLYGKSSDRRWSDERLRKNIKDFFT